VLKEKIKYYVGDNKQWKKYGKILKDMKGIIK
jgi:hypothetical protein